MIRVGGSLRVPRAQFEQHYNIRITAIPTPGGRRRSVTVDARSATQDNPRAGRGARQRKAPKADQGGPPFAG